MRKTSKLLSLLLAVVMMLSAFAVNSFAVATELAAGSSKETATNIPQYGVEYVSTLGKAGEEDWFKFTTLSDDAYYTIKLKNYDISEGGYLDSYYLHLYIYDELNQEIACIGSSASSNIKLENNTTYYVKVLMGSSKKESTGNYAVILSYKFDTVSNEKDKATSIDLNSSYTNSLDGIGDVDWFKFTTLSENTNYTVEFKNYDISEGGYLDSYYLHLYIYDEFNQEIACLGSNLSSKVKLENDTTYYIKVLMGSSKKDSIGKYGFSVSNDSAKTLSDIEVDSLPTKTTYLIGESFDNAGLVVKANYSDGTSKTVTDYTLDGFDSTTEGTKTVTVSYTEGGVTKTCTFDVTVNESESNTGFFLFDWFIAFIDFIVMIFSFLF